MRHLVLTENATAQPHELSTVEAEALAAAELATVTRTPGSSTWDVTAGARVGVARVGDLQVTVRPKLPMDRLVFLMGYARDPRFWRDHTVLLSSESDFLEALAHSFQRLATTALEQGLLHGYRQVEEALPLLRGRLRVADQITRRYGQGLPIEATYDDFTEDIAENQLLLAATLRLLRLPSLPRTVRNALQRLRRPLADVTPPLDGAQPPSWTPTRLNIRYQPALRLAELILAGDSFEQRVGEVEVSGFVFDMWKVYEDFVTIALKEALAPNGGHVYLQSRIHLDAEHRVEMRPDFLWRSSRGELLVVDAKYKAEKPSGFPQADLYQLLAYCTVLGLRHGHLIYADGDERARNHVIVGSKATIHCHTLDLTGSPTSILDQVSHLARQSVQLMTSTGP